MKISSVFLPAVGLLLGMLFAAPVQAATMAVYVDSVDTGNTVQTTLSGSVVLVDASALADAVAGLTFYPMTKPDTPGMVLQYGKRMSFVATGFTTAFASSEKVTMDAPLQVSNGIYWAPLNLFAKTLQGTATADQTNSIIYITKTAAHAIGDTVSEASAVATQIQNAGFTIRQGEINLTSATEMYVAGYMPDCNGNNASNAYLVTQNPISPRGTVFNGLPMGVYMDQDEAFVWIGRTPPSCEYYSYQHYLMSRYYAGQTPALKKIYARLGDSVNNYNIGLSSGTYGQLFALVIAGNQTTFNSVKSAMITAGVNSGQIKSLVLPSETVRFGLTLTDDALSFLHRVTLFTNETTGQSYLNSPPLEILRVTPSSKLAANPMTTPTETVRKTSVREQSDSSLGELMERLRKAIVARYGSGYKYVHQLKTSTWMYPGGTQAIANAENVLGETSDTLYLQSQQFILHDDDLIVAYGVNHTTSGKTVYSNVSCYGATAYNGMGGIVSLAATTDAPGRVSYRDTASDYLSDLTTAQQNQVYAYSFSRAGGTHAFAIPYNSGDYTGLNSGDTVFMGFRNYVDPSTTVGPYPGDNVTDGRYYAYQGPSSGEVYFDQVLLFTNSAQPGLVPWFRLWQLVVLGVFLAGAALLLKRRRKES